MGFADAIPGVSGGTMALILGVYERFVLALSAVLSPSAVALLLRPSRLRGSELAGHLIFLINLGVGILCGLLIGVLILPGLMAGWPEAMRGFFLGLVLASVVVPWSRISAHTNGLLVAFALTVVATWLLMGLRTATTDFATTTVVLATADGQPLAEDRAFQPDAIRFVADTGQEKLRRELGFQPTAVLALKAGESRWEIPAVAAQGGAASNLEAGALVQVVDTTARKHSGLPNFTVTQPAAAAGGADPALWYVFLCGAVAICAMILPGVSGAFLLLALGLYGYVLHTLRALLHLDMSALPVIAIFMLGILCGLTFFSRFLRWLLARHHDAIMAVLAGLMVGSLRALWPFRSGVGHTARNSLPAGVDSTVILAIVTAIVGVVIVLVLHRIDRGSVRTPTEAA